MKPYEEHTDIILSTNTGCQLAYPGGDLNIYGLVSHKMRMMWQLTNQQTELTTAA